MDAAAAELLDCLDAATPEEREVAYSTARVEMTRKDVFDLLQSERPSADWFAHRFEAGPPGTRLPSLRDSMERLHQCEAGPAEAYVISRVPWAAAPEGEAPIHHLLAACAGAALRGGTHSYLATWLVSRAGLAALAKGEPDLAWELLDVLTKDGQPRCHLGQLQDLAVVRGEAALEQSPWLQAGICVLWPILEVPAMPVLVPPTVRQPLVSFEEFTDQLAARGAVQWASTFRRNQHPTERTLGDTLGRHPDVLRIQTAARDGSAVVPPEDLELPWGFDLWVKSEVVAGRYRTARLGALALLRAGRIDRQLAWVTILFDARASDLPLLITLCPPQLESAYQELLDASGRLPADLADALVAVAIEQHGRNIPGLIAVAEHLDLLQSVAPAPDGFVASLVEMVRKMEADRVQAEAASEPRRRALFQEVEKQLAALPDRHRIHRAALEAMVDRIPVPDLDLGMLETAPPAARDDLQRLVVCLVLRRAATGTAFANWAASLANTAQHCIYALNQRHLGSLRLELLNEILGAAIPRHVSVADLLYQRANARMVVATSSELPPDAIQDDLDGAIALARQEGDRQTLVDATCLRVRFLLTSKAGDVDIEQRIREEARRDFRALLEEPVAPEDRARVLQTLATLDRQARAADGRRDDAEAACLLREAIGLLDRRHPLRFEILAELVSTLARGGDAEAACQLGQEELDDCPEEAGPVVLGMLHATLGEALQLLRPPKVEEARQLLERALDLLRDLDPLNEVVTRLQLVQLELNLRNTDAAERQIFSIRQLAFPLDATQQLDVQWMSACLEVQRGHHTAAEALLRAMLPQVQGTSWESAARIGALHNSLAAGQEAPELEDALREYAIGAMPQSSHADPLVEDLANERADSLTPATLEALLEWARRRGRTALQARLLHQLGRNDEACGWLRGVLAQEISDADRLAAAHQLMVILPRGMEEERLRMCDLVERLLDRGPDFPLVRHDLAAALALDPEVDVAWLHRAWSHATRALPGLHLDQARERCCRVLAALCQNILRHEVPRSTPVMAERAAWLLEPRPLPSSELAQRRFEVAALLLLPGPLACREAVEVAGRLLALVAETEFDSRELTHLQKRWVWANACVRGEERSRPGPAQSDRLAGPADDTAGWLVDLAAGRPARPVLPAAGKADRLFDQVRLAARIRPELAELLCCTLLELASDLTEHDRSTLLLHVRDIVALGHRAPDTWAVLLQAVQARQVGSSRGLHMLERAILRARGEIPEEEMFQHDDPTEDPLELFDRGVAHLDRQHAEPEHPDAQRWLAEARTSLARAVAIWRESGTSQLLCNGIISLGNALRRGDDTDLEAALACYREAEGLAEGEDQLGKLYKVEADTFLQRGSADDIREAERLIHQALLHRREGEDRAETLMSAARIAESHPDWDSQERARQTAERLAEVARCDSRHGELNLPLLLQVLAEWRRGAPDDHRPQELLAQLEQLYPQRAEEFQRAGSGLGSAISAKTSAVLHEMATHPALQEYFSITDQLQPKLGIEEMLAVFPALTGRRLAIDIERLERRQARKLINRPDKLRVLADRLARPKPGPRRAGRLLARVEVLATLVRQGLGNLEEVQEATVLARAASQDVHPDSARSLLLLSLSRIWEPHDHGGDPVRDFALGAELAREAVLLQGGEESADDDAILFLARGLRYSTDGDLQANLRESLRLYHLYVERNRAEGNATAVANGLNCIADIEVHLGRGDRLTRQRQAVASCREASRLAGSPKQRARLTARLAWEVSQLGTFLEGEEGIAHVREALTLYDSVDLELLDEQERRFMVLNRTVAEGTLLQRTGDAQGEVRLWRRVLAALDTRVRPYDWALAAHNLANALLAPAPPADADLLEGLDLCERAIAIRTLASDPRHHYETAWVAGCALRWSCFWAVERRRPLPLPLDEAWSKAQGWLRRAIAAARVLGPGEELATAALELAMLALIAPSAGKAESVADEAWSALAEAMPFLLHQDDLAEREAQLALHIAFKLAPSLAREGLQTGSRDLLFVLLGERADSVLRWILRSQAPHHRHLRARLSRPERVPRTVWLAWQRALEGNDLVALWQQLGVVREHAPTFLSEEPDLTETRRWLEQVPGSKAIGIVVGDPVSLGVLLEPNAAGGLRVHVLGLRTTSPPLEEAELARVMRSAGPHARAAAACNLMVQWAQRCFIAPLVSYLGSSPTRLLWSPQQTLRLVPPSMLWPDTTVVLATSLALADLAVVPARPSSTLLFLADPGRAPGILGAEGKKGLAELARVAQQRGAVSVIISEGDRFGAAALGRHEIAGRVRQQPAGASELLEAAAEHDVVVVLAHGTTEGPDDAWISCLDGTGAEVRLSVDMLAAHPGRFAGSTVILLACETGRVGEAIDRPGGVAGMLLAAGARAVVAPLWPVRLALAVELGREVLKSLAQGMPIAEALRRIVESNQHPEPSVTMGRPDSPDRQRAEDRLDRLAFVTWVG